MPQLREFRELSPWRLVVVALAGVWTLACNHRLAPADDPCAEGCFDAGVLVCEVDLDCDFAAGERCADGTCLPAGDPTACQSTAGCPIEQYCDVATGACVALLDGWCRAPAQCQGEAPRCSAESESLPGRCVQCLVDEDCVGGGACVFGNVCAEGEGEGEGEDEGACVPSVCLQRGAYYSCETGTCACDVNALAASCNPDDTLDTAACICVPLVDDPCTYSGTTLMIEENAPCVTLIGPAEFWYEDNRGSSSRSMWTHAIAAPQHDNAMRWTFEATQAGSFDVFVGIPPYATSRRAAYLVAGLSTIVDQAAGAGELVWLGTFTAPAPGPVEVELGDNTGEPYIDDVNSKVVAYDILVIAPTPL